MLNDPTSPRTEAERELPLDRPPFGQEHHAPGGPPDGDQRSPLDGILEDPPAGDHALQDLDRAEWDPNRQPSKGLE